VVLASTFESVVAALGVLRAGASLVYLPTPRRVERAAQWRQVIADRVSRAAIDLVVADGHVADVGCPTTTVGELEVGPADPPPMPAPTDELLIRFTSGTTGTPRAIVRSDAAIVHGVLPDHDGRRFERRVSWLALHGRGITSEVLKPMAAGTHASLLPTDLFSARPLMWLTEISVHRGQLSGGPSSVYRVAARHLEDAAGSLDLDLSCWVSARCSAEVVEPAVLERFARAAAPYGFRPESFTPGYGFSESGAVARRPIGTGWRVDVVDRDHLARGRARPTDPTDPNAVSVPSVGVGLPGVTITVRDDDMVPVRDRTVGEIVVRSPAPMVGYLDEPDATSAVLVDGWVRSGDLGYIADGELHIVGRRKDTIIVRGRTFHATDIEHVVRTVPGIVDCVAAASRDGDTEALVLTAEVSMPTDDLLDTIRRTVWERVGITPATIALVDPGALPRTASGKLRRHGI
jgi:fatty-acyl-CoA synthase